MTAEDTTNPKPEAKPAAAAPAAAAPAPAPAAAPAAARPVQRPSRPGARPAPGARPRRPEGRRRGGFAPRRKVCRFCAEKVRDVDYKQIQILRAFTADSGKILSSRITGNCAKHQRQVGRSIKRARNLALLPYVVG